MSEREARVAPEIQVADLVLPNQANGLGSMFGGDVLALMDKAAAVAALRFCRQVVVTVATERISFRTPIHVGEIVEASARVIYTGRSSLIVRIRITAEHPLTGARRLCTTGYFSMVAVDTTGQPTPVPALLIEDDGAQAEWEVGEEIKRAVDGRRDVTREPQER